MKDPTLDDSRWTARVATRDRAIGLDALARFLADPELTIHLRRVDHWHFDDPFVGFGYITTGPDYAGRHRAESITNDITIDNVARYRAYSANLRRTRNVGHLGVAGRHELKAAA